jgi:DNA processing protein
MPGPVGGFDGCIRLIREGAAAVGCADDILQELSWVLRKEAGVEIDPSAFESPPPPKPAPEQAAPPAWGPAERSLLDALPEDGERIHVDSLVRRLDLPVAEVSRLLLDLELEGAVRQWPGMYYSREVA